MTADPPTPRDTGGLPVWAERWPMRRDFLDRPISDVQDALERWQAKVRLWDLEDAGGWQEVCARVDEPKPPLHQPWADSSTPRDARLKAAADRATPKEQP